MFLDGCDHGRRVTDETDDCEELSWNSSCASSIAACVECWDCLDLYDSCWSPSCTVSSSTASCCTSGITTASAAPAAMFAVKSSGTSTSTGAIFSGGARELSSVLFLGGDGELKLTALGFALDRSPIPFFAWPILLYMKPVDESGAGEATWSCRCSFLRLEPLATMRLISGLSCFIVDLGMLLTRRSADLCMSSRKGSVWLPAPAPPRVGLD